jgi:hypothetical protein
VAKVNIESIPNTLNKPIWFCSESYLQENQIIFILLQGSNISLIKELNLQNANSSRNLFDLEKSST